MPQPTHRHTWQRWQAWALGAYKKLLTNCCLATKQCWPNGDTKEVKAKSKNKIKTHTHTRTELNRDRWLHTLGKTNYKEAVPEFLLRHRGLRIWLQWLGILWRYRFNPCPGTVGLRSSVAIAAAWIWFLAWELLCAASAAKRKKKKGINPGKSLNQPIRQPGNNNNNDRIYNSSPWEIRIQSYNILSKMFSFQ